VDTVTDNDHVAGIDFLEPAPRKMLYESVAQQIAELIANEKWLPGQRIPSERELAKHLGVSRTSIREALRGLQATGIIEIKLGEGTFVTASSTENDPCAQIDSILKSANLLDIYDARECLETQIALFAADRASEQEVQYAETVLDAMVSAIDRGEAPAEQDQQFHKAIGQMTGNPVMLQLQAILLDKLDDHLRKSLSVESRARLAVIEHRKILEYIKDGEGLKAQKAMLAHLRNCEKVLFFS
jgi:GntR family transcriptional repressor for pyruvate dehydrogenase complex